MSGTFAGLFPYFLAKNQSSFSFVHVVFSCTFVFLHSIFFPKNVITAKSAIPWSTQRTVLTQEILRVLLNCSKRLPWDVPTRHVNDVMMKMQYSGYSKKFRYEVVKSALKAYDDRVSADESGIRPLYRPKEWKTKERASEKQRKKNNWYKTRGDDAVIFIPATPKS